jgi:hypothetical protein
MDSKTVEDALLQFDTAALPREPGHDAAAAGVSCGACAATLANEYFDVNGISVCAPCHARLAEHAETPPGWLPVLRALAFGMAAAIAGAILYFAVVTITHLEIGIVAIAIGYMVGYAVRRGPLDGAGGDFKSSPSYSPTGRSASPTFLSPSSRLRPIRRSTQRSSRPGKSPRRVLAAALEAPRRPCSSRWPLCSVFLSPCRFSSSPGRCPGD